MVDKLSPLDYGMKDYIKFYFCLSLANGNLYNKLINLYGRKLDFEKEICITDSEALYIKQGFNQIKKIYDYVDIENVDYLKIFDQKVLDIEFPIELVSKYLRGNLLILEEIMRILICLNF